MTLKIFLNHSLNNEDYVFIIMKKVLQKQRDNLTILGARGKSISSSTMYTLVHEIPAGNKWMWSHFNLLELSILITLF